MPACMWLLASSFQKGRNRNKLSCLGLSHTEEVSLQAGSIQNVLGALLLVLNADNGLGVKDFVSKRGWGVGFKL